MELEASESVVFHGGGPDSILMPGIGTDENANILFENLASTLANDSGERIEIPEKVATNLNCSEPERSDSILNWGNGLVANTNYDPSCLKLGDLGSVSGGGGQTMEDANFQSWELLQCVSRGTIEAAENTGLHISSFSLENQDDFLKEGVLIPPEKTNFQGSAEGSLEGGIEVPETARFHLRSRWVKQSPGGFLEGGVIVLPPTCTRLTISCKEPCFLHMPFYNGRKRDVHSHSRDCVVDCSRVFADMEEGSNGQPAKGIEHSLQVEGKKLMYGRKEVAEVVTEKNRLVVHLGGRSGNLKIAVVKPLTKQVDLSKKKNLEEEVKTTRIYARFYSGSLILKTAESKMITAVEKKKRKIKDLVSNDLDDTVGKANTESMKKRKTKDLASTDCASLPSQFQTFTNFSLDILNNSNLGDIFTFKGDQRHVPPNPLKADEDEQSVGGLVGNMDGGCVRAKVKEADVSAEEAGILPKMLTETDSVPNVFHEDAAKEKVVGMGLAISSGYYQQGWSNTDGEVGEDARFVNFLDEAIDEFDLDAMTALIPKPNT